MEYKYIDEIKKKLLEDSFSVFCGSGAVADAGLGCWEKLFSQKTQDFYNKKIDNDLYFLAGLEEKYYNNTNFYNDIVEKLNDKKRKKSKHIDAIINLNLNQVWTTNFDTIIEDTIREKFQTYPAIIKSSNDLLKERLNKPYTVYKLNGSIEDRESMILTKADFLEYMDKQRMMFELLKRQLVLDSFLFIGYSFADELVLSALREIKKNFSSIGNTHYRFLKQKQDEESPLWDEYYEYTSRYYEEEYNIKTIVVDDYCQIDEYLEELYKRYCNNNIFIAGSFRNIGNSTRLYYEKLVSEIVKNLFLNCYSIYSGNGRGLGEIVVAQVENYKKKHNGMGRFINRPLIFTGDSTEEKANKNDLIMKDCHTMIIISGQDETLEASINVINQFKKFSAQKTDKAPLIIPIPTTGYAAKKIYNSEEFQNTYYYRQHRNIFDQLKGCDSIDEISRLIVNLINLFQQEP